MRKQRDYDDEYPTCTETYATLRIMADDLDPHEITRLLGISPSETLRAGDARPPKPGRVWEHCGWYLTSSGVVASRDLRRHLDWLLDQIAEKQDIFAMFTSHGYLVDIPCFWSSAQGHGGPIFSPQQMTRLGTLGIELWIDLY